MFGHGARFSFLLRYGRLPITRIPDEEVPDEQARKLATYHRKITQDVQVQGLSLAEQTLFKKALAPDPRERYQTVEELLQALLRV